MIIAITGYAGSGKDEASRVLTKRLIKPYINYKFASPIKKILKTVFSWDDRHLEGELKEVVDPYWEVSPREMMQIVGTEMFRKHLPEKSEGMRNSTGEGIWVKVFERFYQSNPNKNIVITDLRFPNELTAIRRLGGYAIRIERDNSREVMKHASESFIGDLDVDYIIKNNSTISELRKRVLIIEKEIMRR